MITPKEWKKLKVGDLLYIANTPSPHIKTAKINEINDNCITIENDNGGNRWIYPPRVMNYFCKKNDAIKYLMLVVKHKIKKQQEILLKLQNQWEKEND